LYENVELLFVEASQSSFKNVGEHSPLAFLSLKEVQERVKQILKIEIKNGRSYEYECEILTNTLRPNDVLRFAFVDDSKITSVNGFLKICNETQFIDPYVLQDDWLAITNFESQGFYSLNPKA
jgi:predicted DNA-binding ArsR family transcriptional regulator